MYISPQIVVGFHGCDRSTFNSVIKQGNHLSKSANKYDWLGHGIYFWEGSYERAFDWAKNSSKVPNPSVIGAFIRLGNCLDLLDAGKIDYLRYYQGFKPSSCPSHCLFYSSQQAICDWLF